MLVNEDISIFDFPMKMELMYSDFIPNSQFQTNEKRVFFRENTSTMDLIFGKIYLSNLNDGCKESCEIQ